MSNFNYLRISNLNYNNNSSRIDDQLFFLNGENTMLNLRNCGGKTVIIQMMMAPFVRRKYRDLNERRFDSYFTSRVPTYILMEWNLEDGAGYLLTGMMVRKREVASDEDSRDKLDVVNFIYEYKSRNEYDIKSIPIIEESSNGRKIKSFANSRKMFEELKKNPNYDFNYYDMNNYTSSKAYFDKLREYGIDNKEWENIIKKVNLSESGLSQLFKDSKNTEGLVKKWFLPIVEEKLNKDENRIERYRDLIGRYIEQYKINKSDIDRKNKIEVFYERADKIQEAALVFEEQIDSKKQHENKIANYIKLLNDMSEDEKRAIEDVLEKVEETKEQIKEVRYEQISLDIHSKLDMMKELESNISKDIVIRDEYSKELENLKKEKNILDCANVYDTYITRSRELQELEIKIKVLKDKEKDNAPEINNLGYSIKKLLSEELDRMLVEEEQNKKDKEENISKKEELENKINTIEEKIKGISFSEGELLQKTKIFDRYEQSFIKNYDEKLQRNILGYFDEEEKIKLERKIEQDKKQLDDAKKELEENITKNNRILKAKESEKDTLNLKNVQIGSDINAINEKINEFNKDIANRKDIIKYVNLDESKLFDNEEIISEFNKRIYSSNLEYEELCRKKDSIIKDINKLKTGKVIEIPKEFLEFLENNDIEIIYGIDWLKKNQYSKEENEAIIRNNPLIPYSLIMNKKDIEILSNANIGAYTSFPITIIEREYLNDKVEQYNKLVNLDNIKLYVSFNNRLLDEEELKKLIDLKEEERKIVVANIEEKLEAVNLYNEKKAFIINSTLTKKLYDDTLISLEEKENELKSNKELVIVLAKEIGVIQEKIEQFEADKEKLAESIRKLQSKEKDFVELIIQYENYCINKEAYEKVIRDKNTYEVEKDSSKKELISTNKRIDEIAEKLRNLKDKISKCNTDLIAFKQYNEGTFKDKDLEDLLAEYNVITKKIYGDISELENEKDKKAKEYEKYEKQLVEKQTRYGLKEEEFRNVIYDFSKVSEIEGVIEQKEDSIKKIEKEISNFEKDKAVEKTKISTLKEELKKLVNTDVPKAKDKIFDRNFDEKLAELRVNIEALEKEKLQYEEDRKLIEINISSLGEYEFKIDELLEIKIEIKDIDETVKRLKRDYRIINSKINNSEKVVYDLITKVENEEIFKSDSLFKDTIKGLVAIYQDPKGLLNQLEIAVTSYERLVEQLMSNIQLINEEERQILSNLYEYILLVNNNINKIDDNSAINIAGKSVKMLKISVVDVEENKEMYTLRIKEYIEDLRDHCVRLLENNENIKEYIERNINIIKLYDEIISIGNIDIKLYKIEENKQKQISWDEVATNSGGEGFLSAFVILSSLLSYMRKEDKDIFVRKEVSKVLIMDNPFAQTNAEHLLKPLIDMAKKSKTQLICLTGLGGDSIINRFDNIYVLNLVSSKLKNGLKVMKSEHIVGDEEAETIIAAHIRSEESEQQRLF